MNSSRNHFKDSANSKQTFGARPMAFQFFATLEKIDISKSADDHMSLIHTVETGDKTLALELVIEHIHHGFDMQLKGLLAR